MKGEGDRLIQVRLSLRRKFPEADNSCRIRIRLGSCLQLIILQSLYILFWGQFNKTLTLVAYKLSRPFV